MPQGLRRYLLIATAILAFLLWSIHFSAAIGINGDNQLITFKPNLQWKYSYSIVGADNMDSYITGNLPNMSDIVTLEDLDPGGGPRSITAHFNFPSDLPPGTYEVYLGAKEHPAGGAPVGGIAAIQLRIRIKVLYPGKWIDVNWGMPSGNVNEIVPITVGVTNNGIANLSRVNGKIEIYNPQGTLLKTIYTDTQPLLSDTSLILHSLLNTSGFLPDNYLANLSVYYDEKSAGPYESPFRIGNANISIINFTTDFAKDAINKLDIQILSGWNGELQQVFGVITVNGKILQTPTVSIESFSPGTLTTYWETQGLAYGTYPAIITVHYSYKDQNGKLQDLTTATSTQFTITPSKEPQDQRPAELKSAPGITLSTTTLLYILLALLVLVNIVYLLRKRNPPRISPPGPAP